MQRQAPQEQGEQQEEKAAGERHRRLRRRLALGLLGLICLLALAVVAASWKLSSALLVPAQGPGQLSERVVAVDEETITLERSDAAARPGIYGLSWEGGHAIVGDVLESGKDSVVRKLRSLEGELGPGAKVAVDPHVWQGDPEQARGLAYEEVAIPGELGAMPAWRVDPPGRRAETWAIFVHGIDGTREAALRVMPALRRAGLTTLAISYRNDAGAPPSPDGKHHLGQSEWRDVEAAADYAFEQGARRLVVIGYSMGGAITTQFAQHSRHRERIAGLVLDSPALSWKPILAYDATELGLPAWAAAPVRWMVSLRIDVDWDRLDALKHTDQLRFATLLFHGTEDTVVPFETSAEYALKLSEEVRFFGVARAGHVESWNVNPRLYEQRLRDFLAEIGVARSAAPAARAAG